MSRQKAILCVDDEEIILNSLLVQVEDIINSEYDDYIVEVALDADEAHEILDEFEEQGTDLALVISDYIMPNMKGDELLIEIHNRYPNALKIMLTGQANLDGVQNAINQAQLYRYISKPWSGHDLDLTIKEAIKSYETQNHLETIIAKRTNELTTVTRELENKNKDLNRYINMYKEYSLYSETDTNGLITDVSESLLSLTGYKKNELIGKTHAVLKYPNTSEDIYADLWNTITSGKNWSSELSIKSKKGELIWTEALIYPQFDENNNIIGYASARQDITDKKIIETLSVTCPLTKLYNRRHFNTTMSKELNRAKRENHNLIFMMIDIDHFKLYNDTYGHQMGDGALISVSNVLLKYTHRGNDFAFRFGGEEFCILTSTMDEKEAFEYANTIRQAIEDLQIKHEKNSVSDFITVSVGLFLFEPHMSYNEEQIIKFADDALYEVKETSRNKVSSYKEK